MVLSTYCGPSENRPCILPYKGGHFRQVVKGQLSENMTILQTKILLEERPGCFPFDRWSKKWALLYYIFSISPFHVPVFALQFAAHCKHIVNQSLLSVTVQMCRGLYYKMQCL